MYIECGCGARIFKFGDWYEHYQYGNLWRFIRNIFLSTIHFS